MGSRVTNVVGSVVVSDLVLRSVEFVEHEKATINQMKMFDFLMER